MAITVWQVKPFHVKKSKLLWNMETVPYNVSPPSSYWYCGYWAVFIYKISNSTFSYVDTTG